LDYGLLSFGEGAKVERSLNAGGEKKKIESLLSPFTRCGRYHRADFI